ncbi:hypothetical protein [Amnibacterium kyonggiense]|uniref:Uncharacterized protein n=1 Tax=Amnibacterium kyonggiense TaxID=595671 RepID=A0A4R7FLA5_9MICO|nr:hypothetical protein [Amnibacterium kyonggiense]TDS77163.1 hypothetical protein CLV52_2103 [Amnibacterium kyonggiense]
MTGEDAESLRRRLYAPGASDADVERFRGAEPVAVVEADRPAAEPESALPTGRSRTRLAAVLVLALVLLVAVLAVAVGRLATDAGRPETPPTALRMTAEDRQDIATAFADGTNAGIAAFLVTHRAPPALRTATRFFTEEHAGTGPATVDLEPAPASAFQGRATVLLVLQQPGRVSWSAFRRQVDATGEQRLVLQRQRGGELDGEQLTADTFPYRSGDRPVQVRIDAPPGARWGFAVVYSD